MMTLLQAVLLSVGLFGRIGVGAQVPAVRTYRSDRLHFSVNYPASWHRAPLERAGVLDIVNFDFPWSQRVHGFVLPRSGADITVLPLALDENATGITTIEQWLAKNSVGAQHFTRRDLTVSRPQPGHCTQLLEAQWDWKGDAAAYTHETVYYCAVQGRLFRIWLENWLANPAQDELRSAALGIALSLELV